MSMRPIDLQSMVPRSYEINRTSSVEAARPEQMQHHFAKQLDKEVKHEEQFVKESTRSEKGIVDKDGRNKNKNSGNKEDKNKKNKTAAHKSLGMVDIQI